MYNFKNTYIIVICFLAFISCQGKTENNHESEQQITSPTTRTEKETTVLFDDDRLNDILSQYFILRDALTENDIQQARIAALLLQEASKNYPQMTNFHQKSVSLIGKDNIDDQRIIFHDLSKELVRLLQEQKLTPIQGALYIAHCPMAFDDAGAYWISTGKTIVNPYFGEEMLNCGNITRTIK
ncbi:DUF3347 domain-containing protein [Olivibacter sitiensis]|uniref:DUF3347 domain-containing protein n=1 Tax=Olivibacter sitiensis TaxID=376470 RepID=UPI000409FA40|nr:DUF3347 domain-containing protein [Olivibacter sitiensis]